MIKGLFKKVDTQLQFPLEESKESLKQRVIRATELFSRRFINHKGENKWHTKETKLKIR